MNTVHPIIQKFRENKLKHFDNLFESVTDDKVIAECVKLARLFVIDVVSESEKLLLEVDKQAREETAKSILIHLDELEIRQPEDLKTDNWRNWKYIRNSIVDKYLQHQERKGE